MIRIFRRLEKLSAACTCAPRDWGGEYWKHEPCAACDEWWEEYRVLHDALNLMPHQWPGIRHPDEQCPYPTGCYAAEHWHRERQGETAQEAIRLYLELEAASRALSKAERSGKRG